MAIEFHAFDPLNGTPLGELDPKAWKFNDPIWLGGSCEMTLTIPRKVTALKNQTEPDNAALYVTDGSSYLWGGVIDFRSRKPGAQEIVVKAQHWKSWLYTRLIPTNWFRTKDKYAMAYELIDFAVSDYGCPVISRPTALAGTGNQEYTVNPFWSVGQALDSFGQRDGGFEWAINFRDRGPGQSPELYLELFPPGAERGDRPLLFLDQTQSTNRIAVGSIDEDAVERRPRVFAINDGQWPDVLVVKDEDPALPSRNVLLREAVSTHQGVVFPVTLLNHARSERISRMTPMTTLSVDHPMGQPPVTAYRAGDRARLRIRDEWQNTDVRGIRIADRAVTKAAGSPPIATVVLDLTDVMESVL